MARLKDKYRSEVMPALKEHFGYKNVMEIPRLEKIVINMGLGDCKDNSKALELAVTELATISGQKPLVTKAKKSIANFKVRAGMNVGANLLKMDSTINVNAVCEGIRDMFRGNPRLSAADAETFYLSYVNYALPEKARAYEEQFLLDIAKSNRSYARTSSGVTSDTFLSHG